MGKTKNEQINNYTHWTTEEELALVKLWEANKYAHTQVEYHQKNQGCVFYKNL
jgi:hypothetical protein